MICIALNTDSKVNQRKNRKNDTGQITNTHMLKKEKSVLGKRKRPRGLCTNHKSSKSAATEEIKSRL